LTQISELKYRSLDKRMSDNPAMDKIYALYDEHESWLKVAEHLKISQSYLSDITGGRREISANLARTLGFKRKIVYVEAHDES